MVQNPARPRHAKQRIHIRSRLQAPRPRERNDLPKCGDLKRKAKGSASSDVQTRQRRQRLEDVLGEEGEVVEAHVPVWTGFKARSLSCIRVYMLGDILCSFFFFP